MSPYSPTERQRRSWPEAVAEAQQYVDSSTLPAELEHWLWEKHWAPELRPGRGRDLTVSFSDGEHLVNITLDVYGNGSVAVAETVWVHNSANEECPCTPCERARNEGE